MVRAKRSIPKPNNRSNYELSRETEKNVYIEVFISLLQFRLQTSRKRVVVAQFQYPNNSFNMASFWLNDWKAIDFFRAELKLPWSSYFSNLLKRRPWLVKRRCTTACDSYPRARALRASAADPDLIPSKGSTDVDFFCRFLANSRQ